jgi:tetrahydromethanopterin S-methyltransferase subunit D
MKDNVIVQFAVLVLAVTAGQILLKMGVAYLPDNGIPGAVKAVVGKL